MKNKDNSALGSSWEDVQKELFTVEEIRESNLRVYLISEIIRQSHKQNKKYHKY